MNRTRTLTLLMFLLGSVAMAQEGPTGDAIENEVPEAKTWVTEHAARIGGKTIEYTVTAGTSLTPVRGILTMASNRGRQFGLPPLRP